MGAYTCQAHSLSSFINSYATYKSVLLHSLRYSFTSSDKQSYSVEMEGILGEDDGVGQALHSLGRHHSAGTLARVRPALPARVQSRFQAHEAKALAAVPAVHVLARLRVRDQLATVRTGANRRHVLLFTNSLLVRHRQDVAQVLFECRVAHVALFPVYP